MVFDHFLYALAIFKFGACFAPDLFRESLNRLDFTGATHVSITKNAIKQLLELYFTAKVRSSNYKARNILAGSLLYEIDWGTYHDLQRSFRIYYDENSCSFNLLPLFLAIHDITEGNEHTDVEPAYKDRVDYHFDAEYFKESYNNIMNLLTEVIQYCNAKEFSKARKLLGRALHILQDFYSHSNWIEMGMKKTNNVFRAPWASVPNFGVKIASPDIPTCKPCPTSLGRCENNVITNALTSGYYKLFFSGPETNGVVEVPKPKHVAKCSHGGLIDQTAFSNPIGGMNKDLSALPGSPHYYLHDEAVRLATLSTVEFLMGFRRKIGDDMFEEFMRIKQPQCQAKGRQKPHHRKISFHHQDKDKIQPTFTLFYTSADILQNSTDTDYTETHIFHQVLITSSIYNSSGLIIPIDSTIDNFTLIVSQISKLDKVKVIPVFLISPTGGTKNFDIELKNGTYQCIQVTKPGPGLWRLKIKGTKPIDQSMESIYNIRVIGKSTWDVLIDARIIDNQIKHSGGFGLKKVINNDVLKAGIQIFIGILAPTGNMNVSSVQLRGMNGNLIEVVKMKDTTIEDGFEKFKLETVVPNENFRIMVKGKDEKGYDMVRLDDSVFSVEEVKN